MARVFVKQSKNHGKGLFAERPIKGGQYVFTFTGRKIDFLDEGLNPRCMQISTWQFIKPSKKDLGEFLNHSCSANCYVRGKNKVYALRDIKKDEETTVDYSLTTTDTSWFMHCFCESKGCRKVVRSWQRCPKSFKKRHARYAADYVKEFLY
jgi:SET domain-containing protein